MTRARSFQALLAATALVAAGACKRNADHDDADAITLVAPANPVAKLAGPSITPTVTSSITFVTPKDPAATWFELSFPCYAGAVEMQPGRYPSDPIYQVSPLIKPAFEAADIDFDHDVQAIGGFSCGDGPCIYAALTLRHPEKIADMLAKVPLVTGTKVADNHWQVKAPGAQGDHAIDIYALPIQWGAALPADPWSQDMAKATHILLLTGMMGTAPTGDPLAMLADPAAASARVKEVEKLIANPRERCAAGEVKATDFMPGFKLQHARFAMNARTGSGDPLTRMMGSKRTLDAEVELTLDPAPKETEITQWITEAHTRARDTVEPMRAQLGSGPAVDAVMEAGGLVSGRGFAHTLTGKSLRLSWRTDRIPESDLTAFESKFESAFGVKK